MVRQLASESVALTHAAAAGFSRLTVARAGSRWPGAGTVTAMAGPMVRVTGTGTGQCSH